MNFLSLFKRKLIYALKKKILIDKDNLQTKNLDDLFQYYGSDKANIFSVENREGHGFSKFYSKHLSEITSKQINILELGSFAGASAAAFVKYRPNIKVFCFDVNIANFKYKSEKIDVFGLDINNKSKVLKCLDKIFTRNNFKNFDLIIDDGSHNLSDILYALNFFFRYLKEKSFYVIEDFKYPNYFDYNKNIEDIMIDELLTNLQKKKLFTSKFFSINEQKELINSIDNIDIYKGNLAESDICFIKRN